MTTSTSVTDTFARRPILGFAAMKFASLAIISTSILWAYRIRLDDNAGLILEKYDLFPGHEDLCTSLCETLQTLIRARDDGKDADDEGIDALAQTALYVFGLPAFIAQKRPSLPLYKVEPIRPIVDLIALLRMRVHFTFLSTSMYRADVVTVRPTNASSRGLRTWLS